MRSGRHPAPPHHPAHPATPAAAPPCRGFKALKQVIKIQSRLGNHAEMVEAYRQLLQYAAVVTRNAAEKKINSVLDFVSAQASDNTQLLQVRLGPVLCCAVLWGQHAAALEDCC